MYKKRISLIIAIVLGFSFVVAGFNKLFGFIIPVPKTLVEIFTLIRPLLKWLLPLIAVTEIIGGIFLISKKYRALGAIIVFPITVGILLTHVNSLPNNQMYIGVLVLVMNVIVIYGQKISFYQ